MCNNSAEPHYNKTDDHPKEKDFLLGEVIVSSNSTSAQAVAYTVALQLICVASQNVSSAF